MNPVTFTIILLNLFLGTMITMISSHWLLLWMGLEMNMFSKIPILMIKPNPCFCGPGYWFNYQN